MGHRVNFTRGCDDKMQPQAESERFLKTEILRRGVKRKGGPAADDDDDEEAVRRGVGTGFGRHRTEFHSPRQAPLLTTEELLDEDFDDDELDDDVILDDDDEDDELLPVTPPNCRAPLLLSTTSGTPSYTLQRQSALSISIYKLNRYRQIPEASLRRMVLVYNTMRGIEKEMITEGVKPIPPTTNLLPVAIDPESMTLDILPPPPPAILVDSAPPQVPHGHPVHPHHHHPPHHPHHHSPYADEDEDDDDGYDLEILPSRRATPYPLTLPHHHHHPHHHQLHLINQQQAPLTPTTSPHAISWSSVLDFSNQSDVDAMAGAETWTDAAGGGGGGGPDTSPSSSSDSGISTSDEIFGDIDLSLYDFDNSFGLPPSPPNSNSRFALPPSAEELEFQFAAGNGGEPRPPTPTPPTSSPSSRIPIPSIAPPSPVVSSSSNSSSSSLSSSGSTTASSPAVTSQVAPSSPTTNSAVTTPTQQQQQHTAPSGGTNGCHRNELLMNEELDHIMSCLVGM